MNAIDLFAGCGGLSKGFMDAGFNIVVGVDNDQAALNTFALNHNGAKALKADLSKQETFDEIKRIAGEREIDVIIAGPPCQGFSLTGPRNFDDPRNKLYLAVLEMVKQYQPKGFIIENVPGMSTMYDGQVKEEGGDAGGDVGDHLGGAVEHGLSERAQRAGGAREAQSAAISGKEDQSADSRNAGADSGRHGRSRNAHGSGRDQQIVQQHIGESARHSQRKAQHGA